MFIFQVLEIRLGGLAVRVESFASLGLGAFQPGDPTRVACGWRIIKSYDEILGLGLSCLARFRKIASRRRSRRKDGTDY
jgi:hypothetical protein